MIMSQSAFTIYQWFAYGWFVVGVCIVVFLAIRDLIRMIKDDMKKK